MDYESILRYFYGDEIVFEEAPVVSGVPVSFPEIHYRLDLAEKMLGLYKIN